MQVASYKLLFGKQFHPVSSVIFHLEVRVWMTGAHDSSSVRILSFNSIFNVHRISCLSSSYGLETFPDINCSSLSTVPNIIELVRAGAFVQRKWSQWNGTSQNEYCKCITTSLKMKYTFMANASRQFQNFSREFHRLLLLNGSAFIDMRL